MDNISKQRNTVFLCWSGQVDIGAGVYRMAFLFLAPTESAPKEAQKPEKGSRLDRGQDLFL